MVRIFFRHPKQTINRVRTHADVANGQEGIWGTRIKRENVRRNPNLTEPKNEETDRREATARRPDPNWGGKKPSILQIEEGEKAH